MRQARTALRDRSRASAASKVKGTTMAEDNARTDDGSDSVTELAELRATVADLARKLRAYGLDRLEALRGEVEEEA